jgi:flagellar biosynthesis protein FlhF
MSVQTFQAPTMAEALGKVKAELGSAAVILHTRSFQRGGVFGIGKKNVVEITATLDHAPKARKASNQNAGGNDEMMSKRTATQSLRAAYGKRVGVIERGHPPEECRQPARSAEETMSTRDFAAALLKEPGFELRNELAGLRTMVESLLQRTAGAVNRPDLPDQLGAAYSQLITQEVADEIAFRIVEDLKLELTPEQLHNTAAVKEALTAKIESMIPSDQVRSVARSPSGNGCRSICLVGPTGVGKTTTLAKLAAAFKLRQKLKVGMITIDTYRIAAVDQLRTYANIIGVPVKVVLTPAEMQQALREFAGYDVVLIDTAGRSPTDQLKIGELSEFIKAANPTEVHLVLSSTCSEDAMEAALREFSKARVDQIIFTKLDEAISFGVLLNVARRASKKLSYITTGQDVPDHIEISQPRRIARLILGERL